MCELMRIILQYTCGMWDGKCLPRVKEWMLSCSGSGGDQKAAATTLISTAQRIASQLSPNTPAPTPASTPQANFLNLPNINLQGILGGLPGGNSGVCFLVVPHHGPQVLLCWGTPPAVMYMPTFSRQLQRAHQCCKGGACIGTCLMGTYCKKRNLVEKAQELNILEVNWRCLQGCDLRNGL